MLYIVLSKNEDYREAADLIVDLCSPSSLSADIVDLEKMEIDSLAHANTVFFLTNDPQVGDLVEKLLSKGVTVVNGNFFLNEKSKSAVQKKLGIIGVSVPSIFATTPHQQKELEAGEFNFPLYIKSENHTRGVFRVTGREEHLHILAKLDRSKQWYVEEAVDIHGRQFQKIYWVSGTCFARNGDPEPRADIKSVMNIIGTELSFDTFSADFLIDKNTYWCIDVNPAPALFKSSNAREHLVNHIFSTDKSRSKSFADIYKKSIAKRGGLKPFILRKMKRSAGTFIKRLVRTIPQNARVIEIGSGTGAISALLAQRGFRMTAIDRDPRMLPMMQDSFTALGVTGNTRVANAFALKKDFSSERFACAVSHGVMEHFSDTKIIDLLHAQLAVAERVVFVVPMSCMSTKYRNNGIGDERYLTTSEWLSILECGHFKVTSVYGFGSKETNGLHIPEILWRWNVSARLLAPFAAFNEYWIKDRK